MQDDDATLMALHKKQSVAGGWVSGYGIGSSALASLAALGMIETKKGARGDTMVRMTAAGAKRLVRGGAV